MSYKRIWNNNYENIQDVVQRTLQSRSNGAANIKTESILHKDNISSEKILIKAYSPLMFEEIDIKSSNEKLYDVDYKTSCNNSITSQRYTLQSSRKLLFNDDDDDDIDYDDDNYDIHNDNNNKTLSNNFTTPQRYTLRSTRKLHFYNDDDDDKKDNNCIDNYDDDKDDNDYIDNNDNNDIDNIFNATKENKNNIVSVINSDYTSSNKSNSSNSSINYQNSNLLRRNKFCILQGQFYIERSTIFNEYEVINKDKIREKIQYNMVHTLSFPLQFYGGIRRNKDNLITYAKCRYSSHIQQFKFDITNLNNGIVDIFVSSTKCTEIVHEGQPIFCTLKGEARDEAKTKMRYMSPRMLQLNTLQIIDHEIAQEGYLQDLRLLSTYQKAKSEDNNKNDLQLSSYDLSDLFQKYIVDQQSNDPYIRNTGLPFYVYMYTEEQINVLDKNDIILHFDATGSVIRKPKGMKCKRILYYALVVNKKGTILPIGEMITAVHDTNAISIFLKTFYHFLRTKHFPWPFSVVVVDWSWALINAIMNEWNTMTVSKYLEEVYITIQKKEQIRSNLIVVHSCCAHFQKRISSSIHKKFSKHVTNKNIRMHGYINTL